MVNPKKIEEVKQLLLPLAKERCVKTIWISNYNDQELFFNTNILIDDTLNDDASLRELKSLIAVTSSKAAGMGVKFKPIRKLSKFFDLLKNGDNFAMSTLSNVILIYDPSGYIRILNGAMHKGKIYCSEDRAAKLFEKAKEKLAIANRIVSKEITHEVHMAMIESAQSALLYAGKHPGQKEVIAQELRKYLGVLMDEKVIREFELANVLIEKISKDATFDSNEVEKILVNAKNFTRHIQDSIARFEGESEEKVIDETFKHTIKRCSELLSIPISSDMDMINSFKKRLLEPGLVSQHHLQTLLTMQEYSKAGNKERKDMMKSRFLDRSCLHSLRITLDELGN